MKYYLYIILTLIAINASLYPYRKVSPVLYLIACMAVCVPIAMFWGELQSMNQAAKKHDNENKISRANYLEAMSHVQEIDFFFGKIYMIEANLRNGATIYKGF